MNYIFISPTFPPNYKNFAVHLKNEGVNVLGIGSDPYDDLDPVLREALTEYYKVIDMENYEEMLKACAFFTYKYGKIDRIESHNEYWLQLDARLRTDFNVFGYKNDDIENVKFKSKMKEVYRAAGIPVARGAVVRTLEEAQALIKNVSYPVCAKPDNGVGATDTYKISSDTELMKFFATKPDIDYMMEEFINGKINTFDGLVDAEGKILFYSSFIYGGVMEIVNGNEDLYFNTVREIAPDLVAMGTKAIAAFKLRERFFHAEFFRQEDGKLIALEINVRPPGGSCPDLINFANDADLYLQYAKVVAGKAFDAHFERPYFCAYVGIKQREDLRRRHSEEEVLENYSDLIVEKGPVPHILSAAMGNYAYILRSPQLEELQTAARYIMELV